MSCNFYADNEALLPPPSPTAPRRGSLPAGERSTKRTSTACRVAAYREETAMLTKPAGVFLQLLGGAILIIGVLLMVASGGLVLGGVLALMLGLACSGSDVEPTEVAKHDGTHSRLYEIRPGDQALEGRRVCQLRRRPRRIARVAVRRV
jgi:hypothetical protein